MTYALKKLIPRTLACLAVLASTVSLAELQPRNLDSNAATIEAYYDTELNVTWLANANIAQDESFGIATSANGVCDATDCTFSLPGIDEYGLMEWPTAIRYIDAMNASAYLGLSNWRLPTSKWNERAFPNYSFYGDNELPNIQGSAFRLQLPNYDRTARYVTSSIGENGGRIYMHWGSANSTDSSVYSNLLRFAVWPLIDGDPGSSVTPVDMTCADNDGDGWGWDGTHSCIPASGPSTNNTPIWLARLQPRDLDQDASTIEAYYDQQQDITWLANSRLAQSQDFGLQSVIDEACDSDRVCRFDIEADGTMRTATAEAWMDAMNQAGYLGFNQWRLPGFRLVYTGTYESFENNELRNLFEMTRDDDREDVQKMTADAVYLANSIDGGRAYTEFATNSYTFNGTTQYFRTSTTTASSNETLVAWPVHDGDIGTIATICIDTDGDGWGWDGEASCPVENTAPVVTSCIDTDGDGWGWDGQASCIP